MTSPEWREVSPGDAGPGALAAYRQDLAIAETLAGRDPANTQWQTDVAVSCSRLGTLRQSLSAGERRNYLRRGREILVSLKSAGRLLPSYDWIAWFDQKLTELDGDR